MRDERNLLLVIDVQNDFVDGVLGTKEAQAVVPKIVEKIESWDGEIIFTVDNHYDEEYYAKTEEGKRIPIHCTAFNEGEMIVPEIWNTGLVRPRNVINKWTFAPFPNLYNLSFSDAVHKSRHVEIIGLVTDICVISTALLLRSMYPTKRIVIDSSCCAGTTPEMHQKALDVMGSCCIDIL